MKTSIIVGLVVFTGICSSVRADDNASPDPKDMKGMNQVSTNPPSDAGLYVGAYGGAQFSTYYGDEKQTSSNGFFGGKDSTNATIHSFWGGVGGVKVGYKFASQPLCAWEGLRFQPAVEAEGLYIGDDSHASDLAGGGSSEHFTSNSGDFFVNGIARFKNNTPVTPYFGVGVGLQYFSFHNTISAPSAGVTATGLTGDDVDFAAQALAGFDYDIAPHFTLFTEYKFIDALGTDATSSSGPTGAYALKPDQIQQHLITAGLKYNF
ncbi:MAG TPA: outer membrane beta-barrel protein [Candidatus Methylacidiphilales bacterium]|jgi:opacity protein-like surface antigen|nr:outer membrane beta-barrel protein [Candidatus Methylacidiphilales bacterium]